ncbi:MAG: ATP-dependent metallopeptidase FtsH/Yme1/Tma family protein, partial [Candidatus Methylomirabilales bacterium]
MKKTTQVPLWYLLLPVLMLLVAMHLLFERQGEQIPYSQFKRLVEEEMVDDLAISSRTIRGKIIEPGKALGQGKAFYTFRVEDPSLVADLEAKNIRFVGIPDNSWLANLLLWIVPVVVLFFLLRML